MCGLSKRNRFGKVLRVVIVGIAFLLATGCGKEPASKPTNVSAPAGSVPPVATNLYQGVGVVKSLNPQRPGIEIDHEEIVGLMQAMQMEFPVSDASLLNGIGVNDRVDFTVDNAIGEMKIVALKKK